MAKPISHITITKTSDWPAWEAQQREIRDRHLRDLFAEDPARSPLTVEAVGLRLDFSKIGEHQGG